MFTPLQRGRRCRLIFTDDLGHQRQYVLPTAAAVAEEAAVAAAAEIGVESNSQQPGEGLRTLQRLVDPKIPFMHVLSAILAIRRMVRARSKRKQVRGVLRSPLLKPTVAQRQTDRAPPRHTNHRLRTTSAS